MFKFSQKSLEKLNGVETDLVELSGKVLSISPIDFKIVEGLRTIETQEEYVKDGKSKTMKSKHLPNEYGKSEAIDIVGCVEGYKQAKDIFILVGMFIAVAETMRIKIRVGALWDKNSTINNDFIDAFHIELV